jgi:predicted nucleic acid-binding protein
VIYVVRKRNVGLLTLDLGSINPEDIKGVGFDISRNVEEAMKSLESYQDYRVKKIRVNFNDNKWVFNEVFTRSNVVFNFEKIEDSLRFSQYENKEEQLIAVKCWVAKKLNETSIMITQAKLLNIATAFLSTKGLRDNSELLELIQESNLIRRSSKNQYKVHKVSNNVMYRFIMDLVDFLEFYNRDEFVYFINDLSEHKAKIKLEKNYRELPSFKDILTIKQCLDSWYEEAEKNNSEELIKYFPLVLWWNLTTIIPMRVIEFCHIKRNCFSLKDGNHFITFPRMKYDRIGAHRTDIDYDTLPIPKELYDLFQNYLILSEQYGLSNYLLSHNVYLHYFGFDKKTYDEDSLFNYHNFNHTLASFFTEIIHKRYKINIISINKHFQKNYATRGKETLISDTANGSIDTMINLGDLRHIAIINMMMQGYDKVEIQRLAGHITEDIQYSYFNHMENWMDIEIQKMEKEFNQYRPTSSTFNDNEISFLHPNVQDFFVNQSKKNYINKNTDEKEQEEYLKLDLGSCMDKTMPCPSFNWKHRGCYFCKHWSISNQALEEKRNHIASDLNLLYEETRGKIQFIQSLFKLQFDNSENVNNHTKQDLSSTSKEIQLDIKRIAKLKSMLGVLDNE